MAAKRSPRGRKPRTLKHNRKGNCLAVEFTCRKCNAATAACDVCHAHDQLRGECDQCPACRACVEEGRFDGGLQPDEEAKAARRRK